MEAEADLYREQLREKRADADIREIYLAERRRAEDLATTQDYLQFHHLFYGEVRIDNVYQALTTLQAWDRLHPFCPMNITINSPGGSTVEGMHLFDEIHNYSTRGGGSHFVTMTVRGYAASMAAILLQAADWRVIGRHAHLLVHEPASGARGKVGEIEDTLEWIQMVRAGVADIFVARSGGRITADEFRTRWTRKDWWLSATEALEIGFVDEIG
ncbi:hypothetical protein A5747_13540 [Mycobacterium sp. IS-836]|nr:hypothetical protein A5747_13540 [Mycobacterium sp. IS-836]